MGMRLPESGFFVNTLGNCVHGSLTSEIYNPVISKLCIRFWQRCKPWQRSGEGSLGCGFGCCDGLRRDGPPGVSTVVYLNFTFDFTQRAPKPCMKTGLVVTKNEGLLLALALARISNTSWPPKPHPFSSSSFSYSVIPSSHLLRLNTPISQILSSPHPTPSPSQNHSPSK